MNVLDHECKKNEWVEDTKYYSNIKTAILNIIYYKTRTSQIMITGYLMKESVFALIMIQL